HDPPQYVAVRTVPGCGRTETLARRGREDKGLLERRLRVPLRRGGRDCESAPSDQCVRLARRQLCLVPCDGGGRRKPRRGGIYDWRGRPLTAPRSLEEILSVPVVLVVFGDGGDRRNRRLVLVRTGVDTGPRPLPGGALVGWPRSSLAPAPRRRRRAVAARCRLLVFAGGVQWVSFQLAALAAAIVYGCLVKLPPGTERVSLATR